VKKSGFDETIFYDFFASFIDKFIDNYMVPAPLPSQHQNNEYSKEEISFK
jgi:hypothetical protein